MTPAFNAQNGYTFIEVLMAMGIFAVGFLAVAGMQIHATNASSRARVITHAQELAVSRAEQYYALGFYPHFADTSLPSGDRFAIPPELAAGKHESTAGKFTITSRITDDSPLSAVENVYTPAKTPAFVTVSKTIVITVHETRNPDRIIARLEMVKVWSKDR